MVLFGPGLDATITVFLVVALCKFVFKDKEIKSLKWIIIGGLFCLVQSIMPGADLGAIVGMTVFQTLGIVLWTVGFVIIAIGSIKLILELFE